ncbi:SUZ RNA-binding domain-containing isoform X1 [Lasioglossum baleicum]|uniref:SUZ RNA-binding domain-containing isoform X1 n=1 Tax=Lasioglossum baleicum TaxID=434251 RepID=UPI003FCD0824
MLVYVKAVLVSFLQSLKSRSYTEIPKCQPWTMFLKVGRKLRNQDFKTNQSTNTRMIILGEDGMRSQYVPPKPTVKILKRPTRDSQGSGDGPLVNGDKPKHPIKTLKQREQEYAEARKRILGEEKSPEEKLEQEINRIQPKTITASGSGLPSNILRMPIGPDGTRGFNVRR